MAREHLVQFIQKGPVEHTIALDNKPVCRATVEWEKWLPTLRPDGTFDPYEEPPKRPPCPDCENRDRGA